MKFLSLSLFAVFFGMGVAFAEPVTAQNTSEDKTPFVDGQIMMMAGVSNNQDRPQTFAYITPVRDSDDVAISPSWLTGSLSLRQSLSPIQSWTSTEPGTCQIQVFVWKGVDNL